MINKLLEIGFLTGSRAFGTNREDSDYDIVYSIEDSVQISDIITGLEQVPSKYFSGYYVKHEEKQINLVPVHPHDFLPWYLATKAMEATLIQSEIVDPIKKYAVFMGIVSLYKGTVEQRRTLSEYKKIKEKILIREKEKVTNES